MARTTIAALMAREGWEIIGTGGGCTAYTPTYARWEKLQSTGTIYITSLENNGSAPESLSEAVAVCVYDDHANFEELALLTFPNVRAALRAIL